MVMPLVGTIEKAKQLYNRYQNVKEDSSSPPAPSSQRQNQKKRNAQGSSAVMESKCAVCGLPIPKPRLHYGGITCYPCRAFFRRNVQKGLGNDFIGDRNCRCTDSAKKTCTTCRMKKCLAVGMDPDKVLTPEQKKVRFRKLNEKKKQPVQGSSNEPSHEQSNTNAEQNVDEERNSFLEAELDYDENFDTFQDNLDSANAVATTSFSTDESLTTFDTKDDIFKPQLQSFESTTDINLNSPVFDLLDIKTDDTEPAFSSFSTDITSRSSPVTSQPSMFSPSSNFSSADHSDIFVPSTSCTSASSQAYITSPPCGASASQTHTSSRSRSFNLNESGTIYPPTSSTAVILPSRTMRAQELIQPKGKVHAVRVPVIARNNQHVSRQQIIEQRQEKPQSCGNEIFAGINKRARDSYESFDIKVKDDFTKTTGYFGRYVTENERLLYFVKSKRSNSVDQQDLSLVEKRNQHFTFPTNFCAVSSPTRAANSTNLDFPPIHDFASLISENEVRYLEFEEEKFCSAPSTSKIVSSAPLPLDEKIEEIERQSEGRLIAGERILKENLNHLEKVDELVKDIIYKHKKMRWKDSIVKFPEEMLQKAAQDVFNDTQEEIKTRTMANMANKQKYTFTEEEIQEALKQALNADVNSLESMLSLEEKKYIDNLEFSFWQNWRSFNLGEDSWKSFKEFRSNGESLSLEYSRDTYRQFCARIIGGSYSTPIILGYASDLSLLKGMYSGDIDSILRENIQRCSQTVFIWTGLFDLDSQKYMYLGVEDVKVCNDLKIDCFITIHEYMSLTPLPEARKKKCLQLLAEAETFDLLKDYKVLSMLMPLVLCQVRNNQILHKPEDLKTQYDYSESMLRRYFKYKHGDRDKVEAATFQLHRLISMADELVTHLSTLQLKD